MYSEEALAAINHELGYQGERAGGWENGNHPTVEAELLLLQVYTLEALARFARHRGNDGALDVVRKIGAICMRCMTNHGVVERREGGSGGEGAGTSETAGSTANE